MNSASPHAMDQARTLFLQGIAHFEQGQLEPALALFLQAQQLVPGRPSVEGNVGITLFHLGRFDEAIAPLQRATAADPDHLEAWTSLALSLEALGRWDQLLPALQRSLALNPQQVSLWLSLGQAHLRCGNTDQALAAYDRAVEVDPNFAQAWTVRGSLLRDLHRLNDAADCFERALALGADPDLHRYYLASVRPQGQATPPQAPPRQYVEALFDDYAADFTQHVVQTLGYRGFETLVKPLQLLGRRFTSVLDLGCGTGLCGPLIAPHADRMDGVDLSSAMVEQTRQLGIYDALIHADVAEYLGSTDTRYDLLLAADVFIYVGALEAVFAGAQRVMLSGGFFAFSVETAAEGQDLTLLPSLRYAHGEAYLRRLAAAHQMAVKHIVHAPLRHEQGRPIAGMYVYLQRR